MKECASDFDSHEGGFKAMGAEVTSEDVIAIFRDRTKRFDEGLGWEARYCGKFGDGSSHADRTLGFCLFEVFELTGNGGDARIEDGPSNAFRLGQNRASSF